MSSPGRIGKQAAQQPAATSYDVTGRGAARRHHRRSRDGISTTVSRLVGLVFALAIVAATVWVVLVFLRPDWLDHLAAWFEQTF
jgi:hypothetical protein